MTENNIDQSDAIRNIVFAWIREDAPLTVKMTLTKEHVDSLITRLLEITK